MVRNPRPARRVRPVSSGVGAICRATERQGVQATDAKETDRQMRKRILLHLGWLMIACCTGAMGVWLALPSHHTLMVHDPDSPPLAVDHGALCCFLGDSGTLPDAWIACEGQQLTKDEYAHLYSAVRWMTKEDGNTFTLPDYRGVAVTGLVKIMPHAVRVSFPAFFLVPKIADTAGPSLVYQRLTIAIRK